MCRVSDHNLVTFRGMFARGPTSIYLMKVLKTMRSIFEILIYMRILNMLRLRCVGMAVLLVICTGCPRARTQRDVEQFKVAEMNIEEFNQKVLAVVPADSNIKKDKTGRVKTIRYSSAVDPLMGTDVRIEVKDGDKIPRFVVHAKDYWFLPFGTTNETQEKEILRKVEAAVGISASK